MFDRETNFAAQRFIGGLLAGLNWGGPALTCRLFAYPEAHGGFKIAQPLYEGLALRKTPRRARRRVGLTRWVPSAPPGLRAGALAFAGSRGRLGAVRFTERRTADLETILTTLC
jgi:hypothetical protein